MNGSIFCFISTNETPEIYESCDINHVIEQMESAMNGIGRFYSYWEGNECSIRLF